MDNINIIRLRSISNQVELDMIKGILEENSIPFIVKDHGAGGHMRIIAGSSLFETDVMVADYDYERANSLLESISID